MYETHKAGFPGVSAWRFALPEQGLRIRNDRVRKIRMQTMEGGANGTCPEHACLDGGKDEDQLSGIRYVYGSRAWHKKARMNVVNE